VFGKLSDSIDEREVVHTERARSAFRDLPFLSFLIARLFVTSCQAVTF